MLVFLSSTKEATSRAIERGTDMRQPEVSMVMKFMMELDWITIREIPSENKGRPTKVYALAKPIDEIINFIESEKKNETMNKIALVRKLRNYIE